MSVSKKELSDLVNRFFSDTSRSSEETLDGLQEIQEEIEGLIQLLESEQ